MALSPLSNIQASTREEMGDFNFPSAAMMKADVMMKGIIKEAVLRVMYARGIRFTTTEVSYIVVRFKKLF